MTIVRRWWSELDAKDNREADKSFIRCTLNVTTSRPYTYTELRKLREIPQQNSEHESEPNFFLENIDPKLHAGNKWSLVCEYTPFKMPELEKNPLDRSPDTTYDSALVDSPTFFDAKRRPMTTTAGEFITGIMEQIPVVDYSCKVNLAADPPWILTHMGGVNDAPVKIRGLTWPEKTLLVAGVSGGSFQIENKVKFAEVTLRVLADPRGFQTKVWNRGTMRLRELPSKAKKKKRFVLVPITQGDPPEYVEEPVPLDLKGQPLEDYLSPDPSGKAPVQPGNLIELTFDVQKSVSFRDLPIYNS